MAWLPRNFIQSEFSILVTCSNLTYGKTGLNVGDIKNANIARFSTFYRSFNHIESDYRGRNFIVITQLAHIVSHHEYFMY